MAALGAALALGNPAPFSAVVRLPGHGVEVASASPERFLARDGDRVWSSPIKGTAATVDDFLPKDRAENVMIVDLVRNDLGRVCEWGSVQVPALLAVEPHPGLVHLVSTVEGRLRPGVGWAEAIEATFPPGSVTGAPKLAALDHIARLEPIERGVYCGAVGWVDADRVPGRAQRGHPHLLDRGRQPALRHRRGHHLGLVTGRRVGRDRAQGPPAALDRLGVRVTIGSGRRGSISRWGVTMSGDHGSIWIDGELYDADGATVSPFDHGITVGDGVFETLQVVRGEPFAARRHLARLRRSAAGLRLTVPLDDRWLRAAMAAVIEANGVERGRLRLTVTGGVGPLGSDRGPAGPTVIVATAALPAWEATTTVVTVPWRRNEHSAIVGLKTTSYAENVVALDHAHELGGTEAIFANTAGMLCEGTGSNVFLAIDGRLCTPALSTGCLAGITRELLMELVDVDEVTVPLAALADADEAFLTSSTRDVQAIRTVDQCRLASAPGPLTTSAAAAFADLLSRDLDP